MSDPINDDDNDVLVDKDNDDHDIVDDVLIDVDVDVDDGDDVNDDDDAMYNSLDVDIHLSSKTFE